MAGKRNIDRLKKSMRKDNAADAIKNVGQAAGRAGRSAAVTNAAKQGASAVRQAAQDAGQKYTGTGRSRSRDASNHTDRVGNPRLDALSEKYEETKKDKGFLSTMEKYMDKDARLKNAGAGGSGEDKSVSLAELKKDSIKIQEQAAKTQKSADLDLEDDRFLNLTKGNIRQIVGSHIKTLGTTAEGSETNIVPASAGSTASFLMPPEYREKVEKSRMNAQKEGGRAMSEFGSSQIDKGAKEIEKGKEGLNGAEAFLADLYGVGLGVGADALAGPLSGAAMFSRSYGSAYDRAEKEGATPLQAMLYATSIGGLEAATEKMFGVAKPLRKLYGKGAGDDVIDTLLHKVSGKMASQKGKDLAWHGGKTAFSALTEALEEMVSEGLEPSIANQVYAKAAGVPHETNLKDILYAGLLGGAMGGSLGGVGQAVEYAQGRQVQDVFGESGTKELAKKAVAADEDSDAGFAAAAMEKLIDNGQGIAAGQARELYQTVYKQEARDLERETTARQSSESIIRRENLVPPTVTDRETGRETLNVNTARLFDEKMAQAGEAVKAMQLPEAKAGQIAQSVARIETGVAGMDDVNLFTMPNRQAREVYEAVTGKTLPETNKGTREALYESIAVNRVNSARAETENHVDRVRGMIEQNMAQDYEAAGQEAFAQAFGEVDVRDVPQVEDAAVAFDDFYRAGRNGIAYADVVSAANPAYQNVHFKVNKAAWDAGRQDAFIASDTAKGLQLKIGQAAQENRAQKRSRGARGRVITELPAEGKALLKASEQRVFRVLARAFNIDIHIVEDERVNGFYQDGEAWLSVNADRGLPYVFAHEITHHMEAYAPEEYHRLKELVRARWAKEGGMDEAINEKRSQYAENGVELSYEDAFDEIIADSTYEMVQDETFVNELCRSHRGIAQSILDAIKAVLKKLRAVLAEGEGFTPRQNAALLSSLDILKDAERLWADGLMRAAENRDAVGNVNNDNIARYQAATFTWANEVDEISSYNGTKKDFEHRTVYMGNTPAYLKDMGFPNLPMAMSSKHIYTTTRKSGIFTAKGDNYHGLGADGLIRAVNDLESPALTIVSGKKKDRVIIFTGENDFYNQPVIAIVSCSNKGFFNNIEIFTNFTNSIYGKTQKGAWNIIAKAINDDGVLQYDNKKSQTLPLMSSGSNTLNTLGSIDFNKNIAKFRNRVKRLFPTEEEISKAKEIVKTQTVARIAEHTPDTNVGNAYLAGIEKGIEKELKYSFMSDGSESVFENRKTDATTDGMTAAYRNGEGPTITSAFNNSIPGFNGDNKRTYSIGYTQDNRAVVIIENDILEGVPKERWISTVKKELKGFRPGIPVSGRLIGVTRKTADHFVNSDATDELRNKQQDVYKDKLNASQGMDDIVYASTNYVNEELKYPRWDDIKEFARGSVLLRIGSNDYEAKVIVAYKDNREMLLYDVQEFSPTTLSIKNKRYSLHGAEESVSRRATLSLNNSIFDSGENNNRKYSIGKDSSGNDVVIIEEDIFKGREGEKRKKVVSEYLKEHIGDMFTVIESGKNVYLGKDLPEKYNRSQSNKRLNREGRFAKQKAAVGIGKMIEIASGERWEAAKNEERHKNDAKYGFYKYDTHFAVKVYGNEPDVYHAELVIRHDADGKLYLYDIQGIKKESAKVGLPLDESQPIRQNGEVTVNGSSIKSIPDSDGNNNRKYSLSGNLSSDLDRVLDGTFPKQSGEVYVGETSNFLTDVIGASAKKNIMPASKAYAAMVTEQEARESGRYSERLNYHGLGKEKLIKVLEKAENPIAAVVSKDREDGEKRRDRIMLITDELDDNGNNVVIIEQVDTDGLVDGSKLAVNRAITAYGKSYIRGIIQDAVAADTILFCQKNKVSTIARREDVQFVNRKGSAYFANNIDDFWANVNWERRKNKKGQFSLPDPDSVSDYINSHGTEFVEVPPVRDYEREGAAARAQSIGELQEKVKDTGNTNPAKNPDIRFFLKEDADITYGSLVAKPDMKVANIMNQDLSAYKNIKAREAAKKIRDVLKKRNGIQQDEILSIWNEDQKKDIEIGLDGLKHGIVKYNENNLLVSLHLDDYLKNAVKVNETMPDDAHQWEADIMIGYGRDSEGTRIAAYFVVKNNTRNRGEVVDFGSLYSVNGKKISEDSIHNDRQGLQAPTSDTISVSDLLGLVNEMYSDILPRSVAEHYGHGRRASKLGKSVRFSLLDGFPESDSVNEGGVQNGQATDMQGSTGRRQKKGGIKPFGITKEEIADNIIRVANMNPVAEMTGNEFAKGEKKLSEQVEEYFGSIGNSVYNDVVGNIELDYRAVNDDIAHGIGRAKAISFAAVPSVLEKGVIIDVRKNWKSRGYDTVVFGAPIFIGKAGYYMGVVIRRVPGVVDRKDDPDIQRHYVHEVMLQKISTDFKAGQTKMPGTGVSADSSIYSLLQNIVDVKNGTLSRDGLKEKLHADEGQFSLPDPDSVNDYINVHGAEKQQKKGGIKPFGITKEEIAGNIIRVANMNPVAEMTGNEFAKGEKKLSEQVEEYFDSIGNIAFNDVIGDVELIRKGINDDIAHGMGRNKAISFAAIPDVVSAGRIIDAQHNWKGRNYDTVVVAAPIMIGIDDYFMAVIVKRDRSLDMQRHYVHEVLLQKNISKPFKSTATQKGSTRGGFADIYSLLQNIVDVKNGTLSRDGLKEKLHADEGQFSLPSSDSDKNNNRQFSVKEGMTEQQRYDELKNKEIKVVLYNAEQEHQHGVDIKTLETRYKKEAKKILKPLARRLGIVKKGYYNPSINLEFNYSNHNLDESMQKQLQTSGDDIFADFAKMMMHFEDIVHHAELIEVHRDDEGHHEAPNFLRAHVLVSAFVDGKRIIPVKLLVKEFDGMDNTLYVSMILQKINEAEVIGRRILIEHARSRSTSVKISLTDLLPKINDESMKKYIPSQFYSNENAEKGNADGLMRAAENRDAAGNVDNRADRKFSLKMFKKDGKRFVEIDGDVSGFDGLSEREQGALATKIIKEKFAGKVVGQDNRVFVNGRGAGEYGFPVKKLGHEEHAAKMRASTELDNLFDAGFNFSNAPDGKDGHIHNDVINGFDYFDTIFKLGDKYFQGTVNIKNIKNGRLFKDVTKIKDVTEDISSSYGKNPKSTFLRTSSVNSIPDPDGNNKRKYSIGKDSNGNNVVIVEEDIFKGREGEKRKKVVSEYLKEHIGDMFTVIESGKNVYLGEDLPREYVYSKTTERLGKEERFAKQKATPGIGEMVEIAVNERWEEPIHKDKHRVDAKYGFYKYDTEFAVKDRSGKYEVYHAELVIRHDADGKLYLYDIQGIKKDTAKVRFPPNKSQPDLLSEESKATTNGSFNDSIPDPNKNNNRKYSLSDNLSSDLDRVLDGTFPKQSGEVYVGETSNFLTDVIGASAKKNIMPASKAYAAMVTEQEARESGRYSERLNYHGLGKEKLIKVLEKAENPIAAVVSKDREDGEKRRDRIMLITDELDSKGNNIVVIEQVDTEGLVDGSRLAVNRAITAYGKSYIRGIIQDAVAADTILFCQKNKVSAIARYEDVQFVNRMGSTYFANNIDDFWANVNWERRKNKKGKFSLPDPDSVSDYINSHETEFVEVPPVRDYEQEGAAARAQSIGELQEKVKKLQQDKRLTHGRVLDKTSVEEELNSLVRTLMSHSEGTSKKTDHRLVKVLAENASSIYTAARDGDIAGAANTAWHAAQDTVENLRLVDDWAFHEYKELRDVMRTTAVTVSETDRGDIPDFADFRRRNMGRLRIVNQGGIPVDTLYAELCETYPELFPEDATHPADQLMVMADVREQLEPYDAMLSAEEAVQLAKETAQDLLDIAVRGKPWKSWADRKKECYDGKLKAMKARHKEALRDVKTRERMRATRMVDRERLKHREYKRKQKDRKEDIRRFGSIQKNYGWLSDRLLKPTDDKHIPEGFRAAVARLLQQIDLQTERSKSLERKYGKAQKTLRMDELKRRFAEIAKEDGSGIFEYDGYIFELMDALAEKLEGKTIDQATNEELASIDTLLKAVASNVRNYNRAFTEGIKESISGLAGRSVDAAREHIEKHGNYSGRSGALGWMDTFLNESMVTPRDFFEQLGGGMQEVFLAMRKGMDRHVDNLTKTRDFFDEIFTPYRNRTALRKRAKPGSKIEKWRDGSQLHKIGLESGQEISLSPAQVMSFYCLSKREQAQGHILGSGVVASRVDNASKLKQSLGAKVQTAGSAVMVSPADAEKIIALLTPEQREMADRLQGYLDGECAKWGNEVSMRLYGYRKFTEKDYFPIKSADQYLDSGFEGRQATERIKNFGFTKGTVINANNPVVIDDIFRVVSDHINKMSLYNAFAAPISDFTRVYNHKARDEEGVLTGSVKSSLEDAYGRKAINYINNFMADVNGIAQTRTEGMMRFVNRSLANYKKATIGGNMRVALQQPTAVMRAFMLISPRYFANGKINAVKNLRDMKAHCQIARWKSWGHNQVDMARDIDDIMMNNEWTRLDVLTMELYGKLDDITWSTIWAAVRTETEAKHPDVAVDSEEFYAICNERASEIFDKTQVVDSVFHRSQVMRNTDTMSKMMTSFMAEPTRTFNMVRTELARAREMWKSGEKGTAAQKASRAATVFAMNAALCAAAAAIADALRGRDADDDGEEDGWFENFLENFKDNVNPLNMLPVAKDIWGFADGWDSQNMALEGYASLVQSAVGLARADDPAEAFRKFAESMGLVFGVPVKNVLRDAEAVFNAFGMDAFAAEAGVGETLSKVKGTLMDKWAALFGREDSSRDVVAGGAGRDKSDPGYYGIYADSKESLWDKITDKSYAERQKADREKRVSDIEKVAGGLSGDERDDAIWKAATKNYTRYVKDGEMDVLQEMRRTLGELGGDVEKFDESVLSEVKKAYKKNIGGDLGMLVTYDEYLMGQGFTEEKISSEIIAKSGTAKEFQKQVCLNDYDAAVDALADLISAGITENDIYALYYNRTDAINASDYSSGVFIAPVSGRISSGYGYRDAPTAGASSFHQAIDIAAPAGSDVVAADGGKVTRADWGGGYGWTVEILHGNGRYTKYSHLQGYTVQKGDVVGRGQLIGYVGSTGTSTGPHLDFKVKEGGQWVDPMNYLQ